MSDAIEVQSHGPLVLSSTYWGSEWERRQLLFLSPNAGAFRLLLPRGLEQAVDEMRTGQEIVISRGPWTDQGGRDALELLFDDGTDSPFSLHLDARQCVPLPAAGDAGKEWVFSVWTAPRRGKPHLAIQRPCWYRLVPAIPCLQPRERGE